jgi:hypothetical protein
MAPKPRRERLSILMNQPDKPSSSFGWPAACALVAIAGIIVGALFLHSNNPFRHAADVATGIAAAFKPTVNSQTIILSSLARLTNQSKLVVLSATLDVEVVKSSEKKYLGIDLGTTVVRLKARSNRAQYFVPLRGVSEKNFNYDSEARKLEFTVPPPRLDESVVEVQSDPDRIDVEVKTGWARLREFSGAYLLDEAKRDLREAVLQSARSELYAEKARESARNRLRELLSPLIEALQPGTALEIRFEGKTARP